MGFSDIFKGKEYKQQLDNLQKEYDELKSSLTPEALEVSELKKTIALLKAELEPLEAKKQSLENDISSLSTEVQQLRTDIIVAKDTIELEEFSLYEPRFSFANSSEYKADLDSIRTMQKSMVKNGTACIGNTNWTVNGSLPKGRKMVNDNIKLSLRAFNNECDMAVSAVKFNNYDRCLTRIEKSFSTIGKLGKSMGIRVTDKYKELKEKELQLALEYQIKKQEEKEAARELRAQQREEAKLAKEIEEARRAAYKEQAHYIKALTDINVQIEKAETESEKAAIAEKQTEIRTRLELIEENLKSIDYREANKRAGYVYIISNIGAFGENIYKIGMTRRLDPNERVYELGDASVPFNFDVHAMIFSEDAPSLENALHKAFENKKLNMVNQRREFFNVTLDEIKKVVLSTHDKTVDFIDTPEAEHYRESKKMRELMLFPQ